jgi:multiple sugar transport system ATP-binding protein
MADIELKDIKKNFGTVQVIRGVSLTIKSGEFMVFVGPSGCGKSTLLRLVAGLEDISGGTLSIGGKVVNRLTPKDRGVAMVFQSYALYPHMNVYDNMAFGMQLSGSDKGAIEKRIHEAADMLQITPYLKRLPKQLSGGQRQRVAIGRAIVRDPAVFLFDEPLSNLDAALRVATRLEIAKLHQKMHDTTMIYVTHDQVEAMTLADRICVLRDGLVEQVGTPLELYEKPQSLFVAGFIGSPKMNFLNGQFASTYNATTIGVRAEHLQLGAASQGWPGKVIHTENLGADSYVYLDVGTEEPIIVRQNGTTRFDNGQSAGIVATPALVHRFGADGRPMTV